MENENNDINEKEVELNDFQFFKNEILSHLQQLDKSFSLKIQEQALKTSNIINEMNEKMNSLIEKNTFLSDTLSNIKFKAEKLDELDAYKKKSEQQILTHDISLKETIKDFSNLKYKYDKIFLDNLTIPGQIGQGAKYKNLGEFLSYMIQEMKNINYEKEQFKRDIKEIKQKSDNTVKEVKTIITNSQNVCNKYSDTKDSILNEKINSEIHLCNEKMMDIRIENVKAAQNLEKKTDELMNEWKKILDIKSEIELKLKENINIFKNDKDIAVQRYEDMKIEFNKIKSRFGSLVEFIKDIKVQKIPIQARPDKIKTMTKKLKFNRRESKNSDDLRKIDLDYNVNKKNDTDDEGENQKKAKVRKLVRQITQHFHEPEKKENDDFIDLNNNNNYNNNDNNNNQINSVDENIKNNKEFLNNNNYEKNKNIENNKKIKNENIETSNIKMNKKRNTTIDINENNNLNNNYNFKTLNKNYPEDEKLKQNQRIILNYNQNSEPTLLKLNNKETINNKTFQNYSTVKMSITEENNYNPGLFISKNLNTKKKYRVSQIMTENPFRLKDKKNSIFISKINEPKNQNSVFGRTNANFHKDYINCSYERPKSKKNTIPKLNVGFFPTSKLKINFVDFEL